MYQLDSQTFRSPRGEALRMTYRQDTNDYNTLHSCLDEDEYRLRELQLDGTALDIGAHIGGVTLALLADNRDLKVVSVEAVPPNVDLLRRNLDDNGLADRCTVIQAAAGKGRRTTIRWAFQGNYVADHHAFVGNAIMPQTTNPSETQSVPVRTLASLVREFGPFSFCKIDCEMCEFDFLQGSGLADVDRIRGEVHADPEALWEQLKATHDISGGSVIPGAFEAVRRG